MYVAVYGACGHTGRFVVAELVRRGHTPIAIARDEAKLATLSVRGKTLEKRVATLDSAESLDRALSGANAVIHCAGPFLDTAAPLIEAALRAGIPYFDVTAEQGSAIATFERFDAPARARGVAVVPAAGFYGGLGDVLATHAIAGWPQVDEIEIAVALDSWHPTAGTRNTGQRNTAARLAFSGGKLETLRSPSNKAWKFLEPFGTQDVVELPLTETVLIGRHVPVRAIRNYINQAPLRDLRDPSTPAPVASDDSGRSNQQFLVDVKVRSGDKTRRVAVRGRDIYAVTAPIVVEALDRIDNQRGARAGALALGQIVDAQDFLQTLERLGAMTLVRE